MEVHTKMLENLARSASLCGTINTTAELEADVCREELPVPLPLSTKEDAIELDRLLTPDRNEKGKAIDSCPGRVLERLYVSKVYYPSIKLMRCFYFEYFVKLHKLMTYMTYINYNFPSTT